MVPTLTAGEVVKARPIRLDEAISRREIVLFKAPVGSDPGIVTLLKRVIGLPNETITAHGGHVYINGKRLSEPYLPKSTYSSDFSPVRIPANSYWVMGDNRVNSKDSRVFGVISRADITAVIEHP